MSKRSGYPITEQRGIVLILSLLVMTVLSILGLAFLATARTEDTIASNYRNHTAAFYAAEAGLESGVASLKSLLAATPTPTAADLAGLAPRALTDPSYTFDAFQVERVRATQPYSYQTSLSTGAYAGLNAMTTDYRITATVSGPRGSRARLNQKVQYLQIPLFQFAAFYGKGVDLEIAVVPPAVFTGRFHSNSDIYIRRTLGLKLDGRLTTSGNIYRSEKYTGNRRENPEIMGADGSYHPLNFDSEYDYDFTNAWSADEWKNAALSTFGGRVQDSAMGVGEIKPPIPDALYDPANPDVSSHLMIEKGSAGDSQALKDAKLYYQADLIIEEEKAYNQAGTEILLDSCKDAKGKKAVRKEKFYDPREQIDVEVTQIDIGALTACGVVPKNGILYASEKPGKAMKGQGVRLVNGATLPSQGLTVVSENPVYIQGDYNTGGGDPAKKVPAAVMGDAIYVLSNNWGPNGSDNKTKDSYDYTERPATDTTVNAAFMLGPHAEQVLGDTSSRNGHFEKVMHILENWNDVTFTYTGSIVTLWHSQQVTAGMVRPDGKRYRMPPNRVWSYDTDFDDITKLPPGTPMGIVITRGQWSQG